MQQITLAQLIEQNEHLDCFQKFTLFKNICHQIELYHIQNKSYKYLCPENIFVDSNMNVSLKEFEYSNDVSRELLNWTYSSPEEQMSFRDPQSSQITIKTDIWSLGLMLNVVFTMKNLVSIRGRIGFNANSMYFFEIISICMKLKAEDRPNCHELLSFFDDFTKNYLHEHQNDMKEAHNTFKNERQISSKIQLQKIDLIESDNPFDHIEVKGGDAHELEDIKLEYKNFSFHAQSKNENEDLYLLIQDRPLKLKQNKTIKADNYEIVVIKVENKEGLIELQVKGQNEEEFNIFEFTLNDDEFVSIGAEDSNQISLPGLSDESSLQILKQSDGFYVKQYSNFSDSSSLSSNGESGRIYIKLEKNTPIQNQSIICSENQRYFVKSIC